MIARRLLTAAAGCWLAGCTAVSAPCAPATALGGTWRYSGAQEVPGRAELEGTLVVTGEDCEGFQGTLDLVALDDAGRARRLSGPVWGRLIDGASLRFDALLDGVPRQHLATVGSDEIAGSWVAAEASTLASGTFRGLREAPR